MHVVVLSQQRDKVAGVAQALERLFPRRPWWLHSVKPPVEGMPYTEHQVLDFARRRLAWGRRTIPQADFWVAIEAGLHPEPGGERAWMVAWALVQDATGRTGQARAGAFPLPRAWWQAWRARPEAPPPWKAQAGTGAIDRLSRGALARQELYAQAVLMAFLPWLEPELW